MTHYRAMFDSEYVGAWDLRGDTTVTIERVEAGVLRNGKKESKKPIVFFQNSRTGKGLALNKTNAKVIAKLYGNDTAEWIGKQITIYPTKTEMAGEEVDCIRVRPTVKASARTEQSEPQKGAEP